MGSTSSKQQQSDMSITHQDLMTWRNMRQTLVALMCPIKPIRHTVITALYACSWIQVCHHPVHFLRRMFYSIVIYKNILLKIDYYNDRNIGLVANNHSFHGIINLFYRIKYKTWGLINSLSLKIRII